MIRELEKMKIAIESGKGGTGKTSLTAAFASLAQNFVLADCDVDTTDLYLVMDPGLVIN
jgi:MinD superfamily P-loop ATPase